MRRASIQAFMQEETKRVEDGIKVTGDTYNLTGTK